MTEDGMPFAPAAPGEEVFAPLPYALEVTQEQVTRLAEEAVTRLVRGGLTEQDREALARLLAPYVNEELGCMARERRYTG